jgi:cytoskeleton protein RodZ
LHGKPPYSLFIGNGPGVIVEYDGKPVDLAPYIKQNQTARFSVP